MSSERAKIKNDPDPYYRSLCDKPQDYDSLIKVIAERNPYAKETPDYADPESFALQMIHNVIRAVMSDMGGTATAGGAFACLVPGSNPPRVILAFRF